MKLTDPQIRALEEVESQNVIWNGEAIVPTLRAVRLDVYWSVYEAGLIIPDPLPVCVRYFELTYSGHAALQEARG